MSRELNFDSPGFHGPPVPHRDRLPIASTLLFAGFPSVRQRRSDLAESYDALRLVALAS